MHEVLNNKPTNTEESNDRQKKVHFVKQDEKRTEVGKHVVDEKSVDAEADGFIQQKHKGFALCKWDTFKVY